MKKNSIKQKQEKPCDECGTVFKLFKTTDKFCSWDCSKKNQKPRKSNEIKRKSNVSYKRTNKVSKKQSVINSKYTVQRIQFLGKPENKVCFIDGCNKEANTVEHTRGRGQGYFDSWAEERNIPKTLDERFWKPCCLDHNLELENNGQLSKKYQLSKIHGGKKL